MSDLRNEPEGIAVVIGRRKAAFLIVAEHPLHFRHDAATSIISAMSSGSAALGATHTKCVAILGTMPPRASSSMNIERSARRPGWSPHEPARWHDAARRNAARSEERATPRVAGLERPSGGKAQRGTSAGRTRAPERKPGVRERAGRRRQDAEVTRERTEAKRSGMPVKNK